MDKETEEEIDSRFDAHDLKSGTDLIEVLARVDERTRQTNEMLERLIEQRINPLEDDVARLERRSRLNQVVLSAITTLLGIIFAWGLGVAGIF